MVTCYMFPIQISLACQWFPCGLLEEGYMKIFHSKNEGTEAKDQPLVGGWKEERSLLQRKLQK